MAGRQIQDFAEIPNRQTSRQRLPVLTPNHGLTTDPDSFGAHVDSELQAATVIYPDEPDGLEFTSDTELASRSLSQLREMEDLPLPQMIRRVVPVWITSLVVHVAIILLLSITDAGWARGNPHFNGFAGG